MHFRFWFLYNTITLSSERRLTIVVVFIVAVLIAKSINVPGQIIIEISGSIKASKRFIRKKAIVIIVTRSVKKGKRWGKMKNVELCAL